MRDGDGWNDERQRRREEDGEMANGVRGPKGKDPTTACRPFSDGTARTVLQLQLHTHITGHESVTAFTFTSSCLQRDQIRVLSSSSDLCRLACIAESERVSIDQVSRDDSTVPHCSGPGGVDDRGGTPSISTIVACLSLPAAHLTRPSRSHLRPIDDSPGRIAIDSTAGKCRKQ